MIKKIVFGIVFIIICLLAFASNADDNVISLEQTGDTFQLGVDQYGFNNNIAYEITPFWFVSTRLHYTFDANN